MSAALIIVVAAVLGAAIGGLVLLVSRSSQGATFFHGQNLVATIYRRFGPPGLAIACAGMAFAAWWVILNQFFGP